MSDFIKELYEDVVIEVVNIERATLKEAIDFKTILLSEIDNGCIKMIIDLSACNYMDSTFLGTMVVALKKIKSMNGKLVLISPKTFAYDMLYITGTIKLFDVFDSMEEGLQYFDNSKSDLKDENSANKENEFQKLPIKAVHKGSVRTSKSTF